MSININEGFDKNGVWIEPKEPDYKEQAKKMARAIEFKNVYCESVGEKRCIFCKKLHTEKHTINCPLTLAKELLVDSV